jgi:hypothetical protein
MKPLVPMMGAITLIVTIGDIYVHTGHAQPPPRGNVACTVIGEAFFQHTSLREKGASMQETLEALAHTAQQHPEAGSPRVTAFKALGLMTVKNVYDNPRYKHLGPAMNRLTAETRCNTVGFEVFWDELVRFGKERSH